jgi:DNA-binding transcriptional LysR family regulator
MSVTAEGRRLLPEVEDLYQRLQSITQLTEQLRRGEGQIVRVGAAHAFGQMVLAPALVTWRQQVPSVSVELVTEHFSTLCQMILENQLISPWSLVSRWMQRCWRNRCFVVNGGATAAKSSPT